MIRRLLPAVGALAAAALLSSGLSSCSSVDRTNVAAEVNGHQLTNQELSDLADGSTDAVVLRENLSNWIQVASLAKDAESLTTQAALDTARTDILTSMLDELGDPGRDEYEKGLAGEWVCLRAIPLDPSVTADDVMQQLLGGLEFADAAKQYSAVESLAATGGIVADQNGQGCLDRATLDNAFPSLHAALEDVEAELGVPTVIADSGGEIIVLLRAYDDLGTLDRVTIGQAELSAAIADGYAKASIWVNSRLGEWDAATGRVVALGKSTPATTDGAGS